jgi:peptide/nickel transport system ATP-binding protein
MPGETIGLVGESGSGKSTLAHALLGLLAHDPGGRMVLDGEVLKPSVHKRSDKQIKALQIVFQNPDSALNRSHTVRGLIGRAVKRLGDFSAGERAGQVVRLLEAVRLTPRQLPARPRQLSGGMKQRVAVARAFAGNPRLVVCDEPTSALDVSVQSAILNLLVDLQSERGVSYVLISHDLGVVRYLSDQIAVLYLGRLLEVGTAADVLEGPHHPYTEALLSAAPSVTGERGSRIRLTGAVPSGASPPSGCVFHTRCFRRIGPICDTVEPPFVADASGHAIRCHLPRDALGRTVAPAPATAFGEGPARLQDRLG